MRTLQADLLSAQTTGYPVTGAMQPAVRCIFTSRNGATTYDYSFNPTVNTNRLINVEQREHLSEGDSGVILLSNYDRTIPTDLRGYYVDLGWGMNTSSGIRYAESDGAVAPRLWVMQQSDISGAPKGQRPQLYTIFELDGVWTAVLDKQPIRLGNTPYYQDEGGLLVGKTIYGVLEYLIETTLSAQTGFNFTLDALGTQDDGYISTIVPFPGGTPLIDLNPESPSKFDTYGSFIRDLLAMTKCLLIPRASLAFKVIYPQTGDAVDETYYSSFASGHPFYQMVHRRVAIIPNHVEVFAGALADIVGDWYDPDHYTSPPTYSGPFMPITFSIWDDGLTTEAAADARAEAEGRQKKEQVLGTRLIIPMDARVELLDRLQIQDNRGL